MVHSLPPPFHMMADRHGERLVEFSHSPEHDLLYLRWHGHLTADEVIRVVELGLEQQVAQRFRRVLNDKRDTSGDWHEALPWLQYEWLPRATAAGLRAVGYVLSADLAHQLVSQRFIAEVQPQLAVRLFHDPDEAQRWLLTQ